MAIAFSILHIFYLTRPVDYSLPGGGYGEGKDLRQALKTTPLSAVIFLLCIGVLIPVLTLFSYHIRLVCMNRTTVEQVRGRAHLLPNPNSSGIS
jgi:palmitoyltransferase ZDHHC9/14/18